MQRMFLKNRLEILKLKEKKVQQLLLEIYKNEIAHFGQYSKQYVKCEYRVKKKIASQTCKD